MGCGGMKSRRRNLSEIKRRTPSKKPRSTIVIVCEGEKTEVQYFEGYLQTLRRSNIKLEIYGEECGSDPRSVVKFGKEKFIADSGIDICYCVIDRDTHATFEQAIEIANSVAAKVEDDRKFEAVPSYPCFEYWLLCHFTYSRKPFVKEGNKSPAENAIKSLTKHIGNYKKNDPSIFSRVYEKQDEAIKNAKRSKVEAEETGELNPSTDIYKIIEKFAEFLD